MSNSDKRSLIARAACILFVVLISLAIVNCSNKKANNEAPRRKLPKDPMYITDVDLENLYDQWEEGDDDKLPPDELPPHKRPPSPNFIPAGMSEEELLKDPERLMQATKKGKTVMAFVKVAGPPSKERTEELTQRWQLGLTNNHIKCERYVIGDDRAIFAFHDGILAFEAKDFFLEQPELMEYSIDQRTWHGKGYPVEYPHAAKGAEKVAVAAEAQSKAGHRRDEL